MSKHCVDAARQDTAGGNHSSRAASKRLINTLLASTALLAIGETYAAAASGDEALTEVVVTARKYRPDDQTSATGLNMKLIDTPQSISVLTTAMMEVAGARSIYDATSLMPGVVDSGRGFGKDRVLLRGNTAFNHRINGSAMRVLRSLEGFMVDRIEVVRGPATVIYGVSSNFGGEINQILKAPKENFGMQFGIEAGDFDMQRYTLDVTGAVPSTDGRLKARFVGVQENSGSFVDVKPKIENDYTTLMGSVTYDFSPQTSATATYYKAKVAEDPFEGGFTVQLPDGTCSQRSCRVSTLAYNVPPERWYFSDPRHSINDTDYSFVLASASHKFSNNWTFKTQYASSKYDQKISYFYPFGPAGAYALPDNQVYQYSFDEAINGAELTFDMSLTGDFQLFDKPFEFHAALQYQDNPNPVELRRLRSVFIGNISMFEGGLGVLANGTRWTLPDRSTLPVVRNSFAEQNSYTGSLQVVAHPWERLQILAGLLTQKTDETGTTTIQGTVRNPPLVTKYNFKKTVPRLGITYDVIDSLGSITDGKVYASYSEGFKSNGAVFDNAGNLISKPQEMEQYEVGMKFEFLNGRAGGSIAWYTSSIINVPVSASFLGGFATSGSVFQGLQVAKGLELEFVGQLLPGWNVAANYSRTITQIKDPNYNFTVQIQGVPKNAGTITTSYEFLDGGLKGLMLGTNIIYVGDREFVNGINRQNRFGSLVTDAFTRVDLYASYRGFSGKMEGLELYGNVENALDKGYFHTPIAAHPGFNLNRGTPRRISVGLRYSFK